MADRFEGEDFGQVADFLLFKVADLPSEEHVWGQCEEARSRCAISRGYYGVFLTIKRRLILARADWKADESKFPIERVHAKVLKAFELERGTTDFLYHELKSLLRERNDADYNLAQGHTPVAAGGLVDQAWKVIDRIKMLAQEQVTGLANQLFDIERASQEELRRRGSKAGA